MAIDLLKRRSDAPRCEAELLSQIGDADLRVPGRLIVVAPHPDDEILGLGGFLSRCARLGSSIEIVAVSDGERAYPTADLEERNQLAETRAREREVALRALGASKGTIHRLAIPDGAVADSEQALSDRLLELLSRSATANHDPGEPVLVAPWRHDLHPDHEATGRAAVAAAARFDCQLWEVPIWSWFHVGELGTPLPVGRAARIPLGPAERSAKRVALGSCHSQSHPPAPHGAVLPVDFFSVFDRDFELILR